MQLNLLPHKKDISMLSHRVTQDKHLKKEKAYYFRFLGLLHLWTWGVSFFGLCPFNKWDCMVPKNGMKCPSALSNGQESFSKI
jgi:hypothetical protein